MNDSALLYFFSISFCTRKHPSVRQEERQTDKDIDMLYDTIPSYERGTDASLQVT